MHGVELEPQPPVPVHRVGDVDEQRVRHGVAAVAHQRVDDLLGVVAGGPRVPQAQRRQPVGVHVLGGALELGERGDRLAALGRQRVVDLEQQGLVALDDQGSVGGRHEGVNARRLTRLPPRLLDVGDARDPVQGERPVLLAQVVVRGDVAALDAARLDHPRGRAALRVDVADPDLPALAGGVLQEGQHVAGGRTAGARPARAGRRARPGRRRAARSPTAPPAPRRARPARRSGCRAGAAAVRRASGRASSSAPSGASAAGANPSARRSSSTWLTGTGLTSTVGASRRSISARGPLVREHLGEQRLVVAPDVRRRGADPHAGRGGG